jgi:hypothetical protein
MVIKNPIELYDDFFYETHSESLLNGGIYPYSERNKNESNFKKSFNMRIMNVHGKYDHY